VFAEISSVDASDPCGDQDRAAHWGGFEFLHMSVHSLQPAPAATAAPLARFHHKYMPRTGVREHADADYFVVSPPDHTQGEPDASVK